MAIKATTPRLASKYLEAEVPIQMHLARFRHRLGTATNVAFVQKLVALMQAHSMVSPAELFGSDPVISGWVKR